MAVSEDLFVNLNEVQLTHFTLFFNSFKLAPFDSSTKSANYKIMHIFYKKLLSFELRIVVPRICGTLEFVECFMNQRTLCS